MDINKITESSDKVIEKYYLPVRHTQVTLRLVKKFSGQIKSKYGPNIVPLNKGIPPYIEFKSGFGYVGVLLGDLTKYPNGDVIQCHLCGKWFRSITQTHTKKEHNINLSEYRKQIGLRHNNSLMAPGAREHHANVSSENYHDEPVYNKKQKTRKYKERKKRNQGIHSQEVLNWSGYCSLQQKARVDEVVEISGGSFPTRRDFVNAGEETFINYLSRRYGGWEGIKKAFGNGIPTREDSLKKIGLTQEIIQKECYNFNVARGRYPLANDLNGVDLPFSLEDCQLILKTKKVMRKIRDLIWELQDEQQNKIQKENKEKKIKQSLNELPDI